MLDQEQFEAKWIEIKSGVRTLWGRLTDDEIEQAKGNLSELIGLIQERYGETKHEIREKLQKLGEAFNNDTDKGLLPDHHSYMRSPLGESDHPLRGSDLEREINFNDMKRSKYDRIDTSPQRDQKQILKDFDSDRNARH